MFESLVRRAYCADLTGRRHQWFYERRSGRSVAAKTKSRVVIGKNFARLSTRHAPNTRGKNEQKQTRRYRRRVRGRVEFDSPRLRIPTRRTTPQTTRAIQIH